MSAALPLRKDMWRQGSSSGRTRTFCPGRQHRTSNWLRERLRLRSESLPGTLTGLDKSTWQRPDSVKATTLEACVGCGAKPLTQQAVKQRRQGIKALGALAYIRLGLQEIAAFCLERMTRQ